MRSDSRIESINDTAGAIFNAGRSVFFRCAGTLLSLGYDMTQPLLAGIVTQLGGKRSGQAMGLNVFILFTGFGVGSMVFGAAVRLGFGAAFAIFSSVQLLFGLAALLLFRGETASARMNVAR